MFGRRKRETPAETAPAAGLTAQDVIAGFELVMGRTPDQGTIDYALGLGLPNRLKLGEHLLNTEEFRARGHRFRIQPIFLGDRVFTHTFRGHPIYLVPNDLNITPRILETGNYEPYVQRMLVAAVRKGDIAIDIGSNVGFHTLMIGAGVGVDGRVHAFEANPDLMKLLLATLTRNSLSNLWNTGCVKLYNMAVADKPGTVVLEQAPEHFGSGHIVTADPASDFGHHYSHRIEVPAVALDDLLGDEIDQLGFLHMDIEGAEPLAVKGARKMISRSPNLRIVTEWSVGMMRTLASVEEYIDWLVGENFRFWRIERDGPLVLVPADELMGQGHCDMFISRQDPPSL